MLYFLLQLVYDGFYHALGIIETLVCYDFIMLIFYISDQNKTAVTKLTCFNRCIYPEAAPKYCKNTVGLFGLFSNYRQAMIGSHFFQQSMCS